MRRVLNVKLGPLDNDSRVLKTVDSLRRVGYEVETISNGTTTQRPFRDHDIGYRPRRRRLLPKNASPLLWARLVRLIFRLDAGWYHVVHCNDVDALIAGVLLKRRNRRMRLLYDAHELETERSGLDGPVKQLVKWTEKCLVRYADAITTVSPSIADTYARMYPSAPTPRIVMNAPPYRNVTRSDVLRRKLGIPDHPLVFLYQGGLASGRGVEIVMDAFRELPSDRYRVVFLGSGSLGAAVDAAADSCDTIHHLEAVPPSELLDHTAGADFGLNMIANTCLNHDYCLPNKVFEYIMAGIPFITSDVAEVRRLVEAHGLGFVMPEYTPEALKATVARAAESDLAALKENLVKARALYNWENQEKELFHVYETLTAPPEAAER